VPRFKLEEKLLRKESLPDDTGKVSSSSSSILLKEKLGMCSNKELENGKSARKKINMRKR
jgi:hypothetical protein